MTLYSRFATDSELEENGVWVDIGDGVKIKIARTGNKRYNEAMKAKTKPHRHLINNNTFPVEKAEQLFIEAIAETILLDWEGVTDEKGNVLQYNRENAIKVLTDLKEFRNLVAELAQERETFRKLELEESAKNLPKPSAGKVSGQSTQTS